MHLSYDQIMRSKRSLHSTDCPACISKKVEGRSFCYACFSSLPATLKRALYRVEGYHEAFYQALQLAEKRTYGYEVTAEVRNRDGLQEIKFRRKGTEAGARRAAVLKSGFQRVIEITPYTSKQWVRVFGVGRM